MTDVSQAPETPEDHAERLIDGLLRGLFVVRIPLALGVLSVLVLTLSDQVLEVHRVLTQERAQNAFNVHWLLALASLVALSLVLWQMARQHAEYAIEDVPEERMAAHPLCTWVLRWGPRMVATLPLLGAGLGIWLSRLPNLDGADMPDSLAGPLKIIAQLRKDFIIGSLICIALAVAVFLVVAVFERSLIPHGSGRARKLAIFSNWMLFPLVVLASIILLVRDPVHLPQTFGSIPLFALWMVNLAVLTGLFARYYRIFGVPILGTLIILLIGFEVFGLTDNHQFRYKQADIQRPTVESAFKSWLAARKDADGLQGVGQALSRLRRGCRGRRALCRLPDRQVPGAHAGPVPELRPARVRGELRLRRQPRRGGVRRAVPDERYQRRRQAVPRQAGRPRQLRDQRRRHPVARSAGAGGVGRPVPRLPAAVHTLAVPRLRPRARPGVRLRGELALRGEQGQPIRSAATCSICAEPAPRHA